MIVRTIKVLLEVDMFVHKQSWESEFVKDHSIGVEQVGKRTPS